MPVSQKPSRPYNGSKFLLQSREYQTIQLQLNGLVAEIRALQESLVSLVKAFSAQAVGDVDTPPPALPSAPLEREDGTIDQATWDEYERDMTAISAANEETFEVSEEEFAPGFLASRLDA